MTKTQKTARCKLERSKTQVTITNVATKGNITIQFAGLNDANVAYINRLIGPDDISIQRAIPAADLVYLKKMADWQQSHKPATPRETAAKELAVVPGTDESRQAALDRAQEKADFAKLEAEQEQKAFASDPDYRASLNGTNGSAHSSPAATVAKVSHTATRHAPTGSSEGDAIAHSQQVQELVEGGIFLLTYDIFQKCENVPNPSHQCHIGPRGKRRGGWDFDGLWHYGARDEYSNWLLAGKSLKSSSLQRLFNFWREQGVRFRIVRFHDSELTNLVEQAKANIRRELERARESLKARIESADKKLAEIEAEAAAGPKTLEDGRKGRDGKVRGILLSAAAAYYAAVDAAALFDATGEVSDLLDALKQAVKAQRDAFNASQGRTGKRSQVRI